MDCKINFDSSNNDIELNFNKLNNYFINKQKIIDHEMIEEIKILKYNDIIDSHGINILTNLENMWVSKDKFINQFKEFNNFCCKYLEKIKSDLKDKNFINHNEELIDKNKFFFIISPGDSPSKIYTFLRLKHKKSLDNLNIIFIDFPLSKITRWDTVKLHDYICNVINKNISKYKITNKNNIYFGFMDAILEGTAIPILNDAILSLKCKNIINPLLPRLDEYDFFDLKNCSKCFLILPIPLSSFYDCAEYANLYSEDFNIRAVPEYCPKFKKPSINSKYPVNKINLNGITCFNIYIYLACNYYIYFFIKYQSYWNYML